MARKRKLGFALGSGGSRGVAHIGFLQAMEEAGIRPDMITGCSMGSVVGAAYACLLYTSREASGVKPFAEPTGRSFQTNCEERYRRGKINFRENLFFPHCGGEKRI